MPPRCKACSLAAHPHWQPGVDFYSHCCAACARTNAKEHSDYCLFHAQSNADAKVKDGVRTAALPRGKTRRLEEKSKLCPSKLLQAKVMVRDDPKRQLWGQEAATFASQEWRSRFQSRPVAAEDGSKSQKAQRITTWLASVRGVYSWGLYGRAMRYFEGIYLLGDRYFILRRGRECFKGLQV